MAVGVIKSTISIFGGNPNKAINVTIGFLILMAIITVINLFGQKVVKYVMNLATIGKLAALVLIIIAGVVLLITTGASSNLGQVDQLTQNGQKNCANFNYNYLCHGNCFSLLCLYRL